MCMCVFQSYICLQKTYPVLPSAGSAQIRIFNTLDCPVDLKIQNSTVRVDGLSMWADLGVEAKEKGSVTLQYSANFSKCNSYTDLEDVSGKFIKP